MPRKTALFDYFALISIIFYPVTAAVSDFRKHSGGPAGAAVDFLISPIAWKGDRLFFGIPISLKLFAFKKDGRIILFLCPIQSK
jgi:hypothetical protein